MRPSSSASVVRPSSGASVVHENDIADEFGDSDATGEAISSDSDITGDIAYDDPSTECKQISKIGETADSCQKGKWIRA